MPKWSGFQTLYGIFMLDYQYMAPVPNETSVYTVKEIHAGFGEKKVLQGIDWELKPQESFVLLGPSGAGKTLFLKILAGLVLPQMGQVFFDGEDIAKKGEKALVRFRAAIGMTFQKDGLFDSLSCGDNLRFPLKERTSLSFKEREQRVEEALEGVGLAGQANLLVHEMSGGMQKRLGLARALLFSPRVLLLDEPAAGLDPVTARTINELIASVRQRHQMALVLVTSDRAQAKRLGTRWGVLANGHLVATGSWEVLQSHSDETIRRFFQVPL
jgi:phospholipid/cholesterol/gamma-HCH transport system ATP-binding protein